MPQKQYRKWTLRHWIGGDVRTMTCSGSSGLSAIPSIATLRSTILIFQRLGRFLIEQCVLGRHPDPRHRLLLEAMLFLVHAAMGLRFNYLGRYLPNQFRYRL